MNISQITFSPAGGTNQVAEIITKSWQMPVKKIDLSLANTDGSSLNFGKEDIAVIAVPSYGGRVPGLAAQRIARIHGNQALCVIVCVYGNRAYEDTLIELNDLAEKSGFKVVAAIAAIAEHSIMHQYAAGRLDTKDENELTGFSKRILEKINNNPTELTAPKIPGNRPYKETSIIGLTPKTNRNCIGCGLCAKQCPAKAISTENLKFTDSNKCISCMRCVVKCPQSARKVNSIKVSAAAIAMKKACTARKENELYI